MVAAAGGAVCVIVLAMAIYMIVRSTKQLKRLGDDGAGNINTSLEYSHLISSYPVN